MSYIWRIIVACFIVFVGIVELIAWGVYRGCRKIDTWVDNIFDNSLK